MADKLHSINAEFVAFYCPGCETAHQVRIAGPHAWAWNKRVDLPTFLPSVLVTSGHYAKAPGATACWCTYYAARPDETPAFKCERCHSFVKAGKISFLADSSHKLAGQTVDLPDWEDS